MFGCPKFICASAASSTSKALCSRGRRCSGSGSDRPAAGSSFIADGSCNYNLFSRARSSPALAATLLFSRAASRSFFACSLLILCKIISFSMRSIFWARDKLKCLESPALLFWLAAAPAFVANEKGILMAFAD